jgi:nitroimidazol reductase NimA-like FMN-containing flavoprotein (pyridoxamine 5'-phosphate oxidase superfamily)
MTDGTMTREEREAFLAGVHVGILAIDEPGRGPLALPIWYVYEDGALLMNVDHGSRKADLVRAAGRATLTVQSEDAPYKYVCVEGPATVEEGWYDQRAMATRYLGPELGEWYANENPATADSVKVKLVPQRWRTYDFAKLFA